MSRLTVLMYHEVVSREAWPSTGPGRVRTAQGTDDVLPAPLYVWEDDFVRQMEYLSTRGLAVSIDQVLSFYRDGVPLPPRAVLVTFDDLWKGGMTAAYPILKRLGLSALAFLVRSWVHAEPQAISPGSPVCLASGEWEPLADVFAFANHTDALHTRDGSGPALLSVTEQTFVADLRRCEEWTTVKGVFAYPFGAVGPVAPAALAREGFSLAFTTETGSNDAGSDPLQLRRNLVPRDAGLDEFVQILAR